MKTLAIFFCSIVIALSLSGCGKSAKSMKLSEISLPENQKSFLEGLTPQEKSLLERYLMSKRGKVDYNVTVGHAIEEQKKIPKVVDPAN